MAERTYMHSALVNGKGLNKGIPMVLSFFSDHTVEAWKWDAESYSWYHDPGDKLAEREQRVWRIREGIERDPGDVSREMFRRARKAREERERSKSA